MRLLQLLFIFCLLTPVASAQQMQKKISGQVFDTKQSPIPDVNVFIDKTSIGTTTDQNGYFSIIISEQHKNNYLVFRHVQYIEKKIDIDSLYNIQEKIKVVMEDSLRILDQVDVTENRMNALQQNASTFELNPLNSQFVAAPFRDISGLLITLPGVSTNNEFSTGYSVRGGNYDENLVYVNEIPVYRPQIITSGQQEGLSFINLDLVKGIEFSSGGWEPKYGDGLSSTLNINYKKPEDFKGSIEVGLLGGSAYLEGISKNERITFLMGARHKSSAYLLNTLETKGEYKPKFTDVQTYLNFDISSQGEVDKTEVGVLFSYAQNRYLVKPTSRETTFGTFNNQLRLFVAFDGQERLTYDTWQTGIRFSHRFSERWRSHLIVSGIYSREREYYDIESGYLLCNVDNDPGSSSFNECLTNIGIGTNYYSGRNLLNAQLVNIESRNEVIINSKNTMEFGLGYVNNDFDDILNEYEFIDSADYVTVTDAASSEAAINYSRIQMFWQNNTIFNAHHLLTYGLRMLYQNNNKELLISPRMQYSWNPLRIPNTFIRASAGMYHQAPLYREFRNNQGAINNELKAQKSFHSILGVDVNFSKWGRPFKFISEIYYKYLWDVNPYDIENVRIRYYGQNIAQAYATGIDFRLSGEFIPGNESWFSLGILSTKENLSTDNRGYIPRPSDQRVNVGIFFQDHIPNTPSLRAHLRILYSTGLPFSPPGKPEYRNNFRGGDYQRIDIGFSKMINFGARYENPFLKSIWLSAEILNLTGHQNTISYYWVSDINNTNYAVPNSLSQRFFNVRVNAKF